MISFEAGQRFSRLIAVERRPKHYWLFKCDCGNHKLIYAPNVRRGLTKSCGCYRREVSAARSKIDKRTHGRTGASIYRAWQSIHQRCSNPRDKDFGNYGGRGIRVCERWNKFENFLVDMGEKPAREYSLDRIDVNGDYAPENCRWATYRDQNNNRRNTLKINGVPLSMLVDGDTHGAEYQRIRKALRAQP